jgi:hypothetical protein
LVASADRASAVMKSRLLMLSVGTRYSKPRVRSGAPAKFSEALRKSKIEVITP